MHWKRTAHTDWQPNGSLVSFSFSAMVVAVRRPCILCGGDWWQYDKAIVLHMGVDGLPRPERGVTRHDALCGHRCPQARSNPAGCIRVRAEEVRLAAVAGVARKQLLGC